MPLSKKETLETSKLAQTIAVNMFKNTCEKKCSKKVRKKLDNLNLLIA
jgi:hypothetical protein